ncbi:hypothetical protein KUV61_04270 [Nocardioides marinus]|nr:hypothetical protein [Nocardioides marinus]
MQIDWNPVRRDEALTITKQGDALTINGEVFDFDPLPEGATLPRDAVACDWLASDVERIGGEIHLTLLLPHGADAPEETRFPQPVAMAGDGPVPVPPHSNPEPDAEPQEEPAE